MTSTDDQHDWRTDGVRVIKGNQLDPNTPQTPGMNRQAAIDHARVGAQKIWAGTVTIHPNAKTGAHHHGALESVIYVVRGKARMRWGERLEFVAEADAGDFIYVPPYVPHQEINASPFEAALAALDRGGLEPLDATVSMFREALVRENHTLKRALTDPRLFSGIGNAYSDEILHAARLSPLKLTRSLADDEIERLHAAVRDTLALWIDQLRQELAGQFPEKVTAFRERMAVHGRFRQPCPVCGAPVQRIVYAENECNYCARCQTGGRLLADRSLSRLLKDDWPRRLEE